MSDPFTAGIWRAFEAYWLNLPATLPGDIKQIAKMAYQAGYEDALRDPTPKETPHG